MSAQAERVIVRYAAGTADEPRLNSEVAKAWRAAIGNAADRAEIARLLGVQESELDPNQVPFRAEISGAGLTGGEVLIAIATGFAIGIAKDIGTAAGKAAARRLRDLWNNYMHDRVNPAGTRLIGQPKAQDKED
jgi:hypothetical protein